MLLVVLATVDEEVGIEICVFLLAVEIKLAFFSLIIGKNVEAAAVVRLLGVSYYHNFSYDYAHLCHSFFPRTLYGGFLCLGS